MKGGLKCKCNKRAQVFLIPCALTALVDPMSLLYITPRPLVDHPFGRGESGAKCRARIGGGCCIVRFEEAFFGAPSSKVKHVCPIKKQAHKSMKPSNFPGMPQPTRSDDALFTSHLPESFQRIVSHSHRFFSTPQLATCTHPHTHAPSINTRLRFTSKMPAYHHLIT